MNNLISFVNNIWVITIGGTTVAGLIIYYIFGIGKEKKGKNISSASHDSPHITTKGDAIAGRDIIIGATINSSNKVDKSSQQRDQGHESDTQPKKRTVVDVTPEYLVGFFHDHTSIQAQKLADAFIGKWMKVSGPIGNVGAFTTFSQVTFSNRRQIDGIVYMFFRNREYVEDRLSVLKKGDKITVLGQIDRIDYDVQLDNCELVDADE